MEIIQVTAAPYTGSIYGSKHRWNDEVVVVDEPVKSAECFKMPGYPDRFYLMYANQSERLETGGPVEPPAPRVHAQGMCTVISNPPTPYQHPIPVRRGDVFLFHQHLWVLEANWCGYPRVRHLGDLNVIAAWLIDSPAVAR